MKFLIDECLSPTLAKRLSDSGIDALHPLHVGRRGERDHKVLAWCLEEDRILITENARDFRALVGRTEMHPGLIIFPCIDREGTWRLLRAVLNFLGVQENPRDYMFNRVLEVDGRGTIRSYLLPPLDRR